MIIDETSDDRETLKACSLSSSLLLHCSRRHLHRVFTLQHIDCSTPSSCASRKLAELSQLPVVVEYADELRLLSIERKYQLVEGRDERRADFWNILGRLKHIRTLRLVRLDWTRGPTTVLLDKIALSRAFPAVDDLAIINSSFVNADEVMALVLQFPSLRTLRFMEGAGFGQPDDANMILPGTPGEYVVEAAPSLSPNVTRRIGSAPTILPHNIHIIGCQAEQASIVAVRNLLRVSSNRERVETLTMSLILNREDSLGSSSLIPFVGSSLLGVHVITQQGDSLAAAYPRFDAISRGTEDIRHK